MVAEAVTEPGLPEVVEQEVPNPSETTVETPPVEAPEDNFEDVLALLNEGSAGEGGADTTTQGETALVPRTEAEIEAAVVQRLTAQGQTAAKARQIEGVRESFKGMDADLQNLQVELDGAYSQGDTARVLDVQRRMKNRIDQHNGHWNTLYHNDVLEAHNLGGNDVRKSIHEVVQTHLGKGEYEDLLSKHQEWGTMLEDYAERYAKKQGWLPKAEAQKRFSDGQRDTLKKLKKLGIDLPRGDTDRGIPAAQGSAGGLRVGTQEWAESASVAELLAAKARGAY